MTRPRRPVPRRAKVVGSGAVAISTLPLKLENCEGSGKILSDIAETGMAPPHRVTASLPQREAVPPHPNKLLTVLLKSKKIP
jgi:hypothetical protein